MRSRTLLLFAAFAAMVSSAAAQDFKIDPVHSSATFAVKHMLVSTVRGRFTETTGTIHYDPNDITKSSVVAEIKASSITTDNDRRDGHLKTADFFDVAKYPTIKFESSRIEKRGDQYVAIGNLTIKDVTKQIELPFTANVAEAGGKKRMGVEASTQINRFDYHVNYDDPTHSAVGKDVKIELTLEAGAQPAAAAPAAPTSTTVSTPK